MSFEVFPAVDCEHVVASSSIRETSRGDLLSIDCSPCESFIDQLERDSTRIKFSMFAITFINSSLKYTEISKKFV